MTHLICEKQVVSNKNRYQNTKDTHSVIQDIQRQLTCDKPHIQGNSSCPVSQVGCSSISLKQPANAKCKDNSNIYNTKCKDNCDVNQKERNIPVKKETTKIINAIASVNKSSVTTVNDNTLNNPSEELSKAKKRRLRKRKLLLALAASNSVNQQSGHQNETSKLKESETVIPSINLTVNTCRPVAVGTNTEITKHQEQQLPKVVPKEIRKRIDKTTLEARKKKIKAKSPVESHNNRKEDICCIPVNNTCQKLQNEIQTPLSGFSFPEINRSCLEKSDSFRKKADSVFYFGETKSELQEISNLNLNTRLTCISESKKSDIQNIFKIKDITFSNVHVNTVFPNKCENNVPYKTENLSDVSSYMLRDVNKNEGTNNKHELSSALGSTEKPSVPVCSPAFDIASPLGTHHTVPFFHNINKAGINTTSSADKLQNCEILKQLSSKVTVSGVDVNIKQDLRKPDIAKESASTTVTEKLQNSERKKEKTTKTTVADVRDTDSEIKQSVSLVTVPEPVTTPSTSAAVAALPSPAVAVAATIIEKEAIDKGNAVKVNKIVNVSENSESYKMDKSREDILAEREARKAAKLAAKNKNKANNAKQDSEKIDIKSSDSKDVLSSMSKNDLLSANVQETKNVTANIKPLGAQEDTQQINENGKMQADIIPASVDIKPDRSSGDVELVKKESSEPVKSKAELRAERRAKQEAQRAAKAEKQQQPKSHEEKNKTDKQIKVEKPKVEVEKKAVDKVSKSTVQCRVKLFSHLHQEKQCSKMIHQSLLNTDIHPAIVRLGAQYASRVVAGSNARCIALLQALKEVISDYSTPAEKEFSRGLEEYLAPATAYLQLCRPLSVSMTNAFRHIKWHLTQLPNNVPDAEARKKLCDIVDTYVRDQIDVAGQAICNSVQQKIANGDVILTYGCSSLVYRILVESHNSKTRFRVIVVDAEPWREGREMLRRLVSKGIQCTYVLISAASFVMREVSKVLLGAHALLANGYVMSRAGCSQIALLANSYNVPVLVCCETHKFSERVQTDAFVYNELGDPDEFVSKGKGDISQWRSYTNLTPLSLAYDVTPPDLVTAVVTELAILPCTSVPVILRIKPSEFLM